MYASRCVMAGGSSHKLIQTYVIPAKKNTNICWAVFFIGREQEKRGESASNALHWLLKAKSTTFTFKTHPGLRVGLLGSLCQRPVHTRPPCFIPREEFIFASLNLVYHRFSRYIPNKPNFKLLQKSHTVNHINHKFVLGSVFYGQVLKCTR